MQRRIAGRLIGAIIQTALAAGGFLRGQLLADQEFVSCYPTYGYLDGDTWVIPARFWVHETRGSAASLAETFARSFGDPSDAEMEIFRSRFAPFVADSESGEKVTIVFEGDSEKAEFQIADDSGAFPTSDRNGLIQGNIYLPRDKAEQLLEQQRSARGWLRYSVNSLDHSGSGMVQLIEHEGLSVISDIDDTIKITEIPAGGRVVVRNTFFRKFEPAPGMADRYRDFGPAAFHYVSGSPWQLYSPLAEFVAGTDNRFPAGTFHMKNVRKNPLSGDSWRDFAELTMNENVTFNQKVTQITTLMTHFPKRRFILVGDSGEKDPEVYRQIRSAFPEQVQEVWIRDVVNARELAASRLEGMKVIPATTVLPASSDDK